jgi:hypothetical protein
MINVRLFFVFKSDSTDNLLNENAIICILTNISECDVLKYRYR